MYRFKGNPEVMLDLWLDCQLDDLPGQRAAILRLERYRSWSQQLERDSLSLISDCSGPLKPFALKMLFKRWSLMRALNSKLLFQDIEEWTGVHRDSGEESPRQW